MAKYGAPFKMKGSPYKQDYKREKSMRKAGGTTGVKKFLSGVISFAAPVIPKIYGKAKRAYKTFKWKKYYPKSTR